jgi:putative flippase GtrA
MIARQFIIFSVVGLINTGIHYCVFLFLYKLINVNYLIASVVGYSCGLLNSFILNKKWTFKTINVRKDIELIKFVIVNVVALAVNIIGLRFFVEVMGIKPEISQIGAIGFSLVTNFVGNKYWTFRSQHCQGK